MKKRIVLLALALALVTVTANTSIAVNASMQPRSTAKEPVWPPPRELSPGYNVCVVLDTGDRFEAQVVKAEKRGNDGSLHVDGRPFAEVFVIEPDGRAYVGRVGYELIHPLGHCEYE